MNNGIGSSKLSIDVKPDGVYLFIDKRDKGNLPSKADISKYLDEFGVQDVSFSVISEMLSSDDNSVERKVSSNTKTKAMSETVVIEIDKGGLEAYAEFYPAKNSGPFMEFSEFRKAVTEANVRYGIDELKLQELFEERRIRKQYLIAKGYPPKQGRDGYLEYLFDINNKTLKPKILGDGKVDYHSLDLIEIVKTGQKLVTSIEEIPGADGMDVYNIPIPCIKSKPSPPLPKGKNTSISEDEKFLVADMNGQVLFDNKRVNVSPVLEIAGNVDNSTGNIEFNGAVVIRGNVQTGFSVYADGDIEVFGVIEGAKLSSEQNIILNSGVQGQDKAEISAEGNISVKYAESCVLNAGKDIVADSIMHSHVKCGGSLKVEGRKGLLVGGKITVGKKVIAKIIGSTMATSTEIEAGFNPSVVDEYKDYMKEYTSLKTEYTKIDKVINTLQEQNKASPLPENKKNMLLKSIHTKIFLREKLTTLQGKINELTPYLEQGRGSISASEFIRSGVKVIIGNAMMYIRDDLSHCTLTNSDSKVKIGPFYK